MASVPVRTSLPEVPTIGPAGLATTAFSHLGREVGAT